MLTGGGATVLPSKQNFPRRLCCVRVCVCIRIDVCKCKGSLPMHYLMLCVLTVSPTCSLMLLIPSGPSRLTACFTRSVRPQLSMRKPRSCRNFASVEAASSFLEAQKQSSVLKGKAHKVIHSVS